MDRGKDISQKIRSAIKAKLIELNAYVDDELPDYIMVMVANKKSQEQMTDDLSLFLSHNTDKFTEWLHNLLEKLQTLGSDPQKVKDTEKPQTKEKQNKDETQSATDGKEKTAVKRRSSEKAKSVKEKVHAKEKTDEPMKTPPAAEENGSQEKSSVAEKVIPAQSKSVAVKVLPSKSTKDSKSLGGNHEEEYVPELLENRGETDEFSEEYRDEPEVKKSRLQKAVQSQNLTAKVSASKHRSGQSKSDQSANLRLTTAEIRARITQPKSAPERPVTGSVHSRLGVPRYQESGTHERAVTKSVISSVGRTVQKPDYPVSRKVSPLKRKQPASVVAAVKKKYEEEDDEEEYDPYNPAVGNVASVVRVTTRRSSVPLSQQANKNLILKATAEAEKSVNSKLNRILTEEKLYSEKEKGVVRPMPQRTNKPVTVTLHGKGLLSKSRREEMAYSMTSKSHRQETVRPTKSYREETVAFSKPRPQIKEIVKNMTYTIQNTQLRKTVIDQPKPLLPTRKYAQEIAEVSPVTDSRQILQVHKEDEEDVMEKEELYDSDDEDDRKEDVHKYEMKTPSLTEYEQLMEETSNSPSTNPEHSPDFPDSSPDHDPESQLLLQGTDLRLDLDEREATEYLTDPDLSDEEDEVQEDTRNSRIQEEESEDKLRQELLYMAQQKKQLFQHERGDNIRSKPIAEVAPVDTRFIVTLDGVDPLPYKETREEETVQIKPASQLKKSPITRITAPEVPPISINLKDTDDEDEEGGGLPSNIAKQSEKCRFWPACVNGNACPYHHPTVSCKMFPNCKFGDKCLYIHPNCKFDSKCSRKDCPFTHASKRSNLTTVIQKIVPVAVPASALSTQYVQSKASPVCRFFPNCKNVQCHFQHPKPCRFGVKCMNKSHCQFYHPSTVPTKDKLTWTAAARTTHKSERLFDAGPAESLPTSVK